MIKIQSDGNTLKAAALPDEGRAASSRLPVIFVVMQSGSQANGGVESITQILERFRRVTPVVVTQMETPVNRRWSKAGAAVLVWPMHALRLTSVLRANLRMYRLIRSTGCRVVHCNDIAALWHTSFGARMAGAAVVFNVRNIKPEGQRYGWRWQIARRISNRRLVLSKEMQRSLARRLHLKDSSAVGSKEGIEYIYSAVDLLGFSPVDEGARTELRARLNIEADSLALGYVAAFDPRKAQLKFIKEAAPRLKDLLPQAKVYFIGDFAPEQNDYARQCLEAVENSGLEESVSFVGYTSEMANWYRALDLVVVASRNEGLARCMIESLACATPVVSFDVCSAREILEERGCGRVVPEGNYELLVEQLAALSKQRAVLQRLGRSGVAVARELFDPHEVVRQYEQLYFSLSRK